MKKYSSIQIFRALAANMVLLSHLFVIELKYGAGILVLPDLETVGRLGVNLFFIISGFVIALVCSSNPSWQSFLWARLTRIYPIYWMYTAAVLIVAVVAPTAVNSSYSQKPSLIRSLLLLPDVTPPWLGVGWSLVHEVYFYCIISIFLALRIRLFIGLIGWSILLLLPIKVEGPWAAVLLSPMTFEFIGGAFLWLAISKFGSIRWSGRLRSKTLERLGDASYSVYLSHVLVLSALGRLFALLSWHSWFAEFVFVTTCVIIANGWGWISYKLIELPILELTRRNIRFVSRL